MSMPSAAPQAVRELVEGYVSKLERLVTNALDARRLASAGAAAGSFLGGRDGGRGPGPSEVGSTAKLAEILWQSLTEVRHAGNAAGSLQSCLHWTCVHGCRGASPNLSCSQCTLSRTSVGLWTEGLGSHAHSPCE